MIEEMPRERLEKLGKEALKTEELIAIILKTGSKEENVMELSKRLLVQLKDIRELKSYTIATLTKFKGIGKVKAIELLCAIELGRRLYIEEEYKVKIKLNTAKKAYEYINNILKEEKQELFFCIYLDTNKNLISKHLLFKGSLNQSIVHPREIFKLAYIESASSIICVHNHPSGDIKPSKEDIITTKKLVEIGNLLGINVVDHLIIGKNNYCSMYENHLM